MLPASLVEALRNQNAFVRIFYDQETRSGYGSVEPPYALARKCPNSDKELGWQYLYGKYLEILESFVYKSIYN
jgi:hypothetical protein